MTAPRQWQEGVPASTIEVCKAAAATAESSRKRAVVETCSVVAAQPLVSGVRTPERLATAHESGGRRVSHVSRLQQLLLLLLLLTVLSFLPYFRPSLSCRFFSASSRGLSTVPVSLCTSLQQRRPASSLARPAAAPCSTAAAAFSRTAAAQRRGPAGLGAAARSFVPAAAAARRRTSLTLPVPSVPHTRTTAVSSGPSAPAARSARAAPAAGPAQQTTALFLVSQDADAAPELSSAANESRLSAYFVCTDASSPACLLRSFSVFPFPSPLVAVLSSCAAVVLRFCGLMPRSWKTSPSSLHHRFSVAAATTATAAAALAAVSLLPAVDAIKPPAAKLLASVPPSGPLLLPSSLRRPNPTPATGLSKQRGGAAGARFAPAAAAARPAPLHTIAPAASSSPSAPSAASSLSAAAPTASVAGTAASVPPAATLSSPAPSPPHAAAARASTPGTALHLAAPLPLWFSRHAPGASNDASQVPSSTACAELQKARGAEEERAATAGGCPFDQLADRPADGPAAAAENGWQQRVYSTSFASAGSFLTASHPHEGWKAELLLRKPHHLQQAQEKAGEGPPALLLQDSGGAVSLLPWASSSSIFSLHVQPESNVEKDAAAAAAGPQRRRQQEPAIAAAAASLSPCEEWPVVAFGRPTTGESPAAEEAGELTGWVNAADGTAAVSPLQQQQHERRPQDEEEQEKQEKERQEAYLPDQQYRVIFSEQSDALWARTVALCMNAYSPPASELPLAAAARSPSIRQGQAAAGDAVAPGDASPRISRQLVAVGTVPDGCVWRASGGEEGCAKPRVYLHRETGSNAEAAGSAVAAAEHDAAEETRVEDQALHPTRKESVARGGCRSPSSLAAACTAPGEDSSSSKSKDNSSHRETGCSSRDGSLLVNASPHAAPWKVQVTPREASLDGLYQLDVLLPLRFLLPQQQQQPEAPQQHAEQQHLEQQRSLSARDSCGAAAQGHVDAGQMENQRVNAQPPDREAQQQQESEREKQQQEDCGCGRGNSSREDRTGSGKRYCWQHHVDTGTAFLLSEGDQQQAERAAAIRAGDAPGATDLQEEEPPTQQQRVSPASQQEDTAPNAAAAAKDDENLAASATSGAEKEAAAQHFRRRQRASQQGSLQPCSKEVQQELLYLQHPQQGQAERWQQHVQVLREQQQQMERKQQQLTKKREVLTQLLQTAVLAVKPSVSGGCEGTIDFHTLAWTPLGPLLNAQQQKQGQQQEEQQKQQQDLQQRREKPHRQQQESQEASGAAAVERRDGGSSAAAAAAHGAAAAVAEEGGGARVAAEAESALLPIRASEQQRVEKETRRSSSSSLSSTAGAAAASSPFSSCASHCAQTHRPVRIHEFEEKQQDAAPTSTRQTAAGTAATGEGGGGQERGKAAVESPSVAPAETRGGAANEEEEKMSVSVSAPLSLSLEEGNMPLTLLVCMYSNRVDRHPTTLGRINVEAPPSVSWLSDGSFRPAADVAGKVNVRSNADDPAPNPSSKYSSTFADTSPVFSSSSSSVFPHSNSSSSVGDAASGTTSASAGLGWKGRPSTASTLNAETAAKSEFYRRPSARPFTYNEAPPTLLQNLSTGVSRWCGDAAAGVQKVLRAAATQPLVKNFLSGFPLLRQEANSAAAPAGGAEAPPRVAAAAARDGATAGSEEEGTQEGHRWTAVGVALLEKLRWWRQAHANALDAAAAGTAAAPSATATLAARSAAAAAALAGAVDGGRRGEETWGGSGSGTAAPGEGWLLYMPLAVLLGAATGGLLSLRAEHQRGRSGATAGDWSTLCSWAEGFEPGVMGQVDGWTASRAAASVETAAVSVEGTAASGAAADSPVWQQSHVCCAAAPERENVEEEVEARSNRGSTVAHVAATSRAEARNSGRKHSDNSWRAETNSFDNSAAAAAAPRDAVAAATAARAHDIPAAGVAGAAAGRLDKESEWRFGSVFESLEEKQQQTVSEQPEHLSLLQLSPRWGGADSGGADAAAVLHHPQQERNQQDVAPAAAPTTFFCTPSQHVYNSLWRTTDTEGWPLAYHAAAAGRL